MESKTAVEEALAFLTSLTRFGIRPTLDRMRVMLSMLDEPHTRYPVVHIAGTNGKGSTARFIAGALQEAGLVTGLFTSPHLVRYNERMMLQGRPIADDELLSLVDEVRPVIAETARLSDHPTEFEVATVLAFSYFARRRVDVAVVEVGMGGSWDSTNVVDPCLSVITPIAMDHMDRLGHTLAEIAGEKAGIIKPGRPVVAAAQEEEAARVIAEKARAQGSPLIWVRDKQDAESDRCDSRFTALGWDLTGGRFHLDSRGEHWSDVQVGMLGRYQISNAALAAVACQLLAEQGFPVRENHVRAALKSVRWPGRLELIHESPFVLLDGAHNAQGARALADALGQLFADRRRALILGMMGDKQVDEVLSALLPQAAAVYCTAPASSRTAPLRPKELAQHVGRIAESLHLHLESVRAIDDAWAAMQQALAESGPDDVLCVCGSLYLVGEVRGAWERVKTAAP
ncbi:MAG: bifunctional folylpolyglutamate synthase/dihydrofolate synthase [Firmicutes bacterium]|jgi:dihydrofolate synthase/folylpolyglutamate synthase|nr:bifunctional folylpolyglutamate synthase/dihydrofolate synthase [Bacillota bacterium]